VNVSVDGSKKAGVSCGGSVTVYVIKFKIYIEIKSKSAKSTVP
jgi:hypothetical protein